MLGHLPDTTSGIRLYTSALSRLLSHQAALLPTYVRYLQPLLFLLSLPTNILVLQSNITNLDFHLRVHAVISNPKSYVGGMAFDCQDMKLSKNPVWPFLTSL